MTAVVTSRFLRHLAPALSARDLAVLDTVSDFRLCSGDQLRRLHFTESTPTGNVRIAQRVLTRLTRDKVLTRLERRRGGTPGSGGFLYAVGEAGWRLLGRVGRARKQWEPLDIFTLHTLMITEIYVRAVEKGCEELVFKPDAHSWLTVGSMELHPDAYVALVVRSGGERYRNSWFLEADRGTEHQPRIRQKLDTYMTWFNAGLVKPVFPKVLFVCETESRRAQLTRWFRGNQLFTACTLDDVVSMLTS